MKTLNTIQIQTFIALLALLGGGFPAVAQNTAFTYQGQLSEQGSPVSGLYDFRAQLYNRAVAGELGDALVSGTLTPSAVPVTNGLFVLNLDFGEVPFNGEARWLALMVRSNGAPNYSLLLPRQPITPTPYAIATSNLLGTLPASRLSGTVPSGNLGGTYTGSVTFNNSGNSFSGSGVGLTGLNAASLTSGTVPDGRLSGNVALRAGGNAFSGNQSVASGSVGLGTVSPESTLDVRGITTLQAGASGNHDNLVLKKTGSLSASNVRFVLSHRTEGSKAFLYSHDGSVYRNLQGWDHAANAVRFPAAGDTLYVDEGSARVGVGNDSPQQRLHVTGNARVEGSGVTTANPALYVTNSLTSGIGIFTTTSSSDANLVVVNKSTGDIFRGFSGTNGGDLVFRVMNSGYVRCSDELSCKSLDIRGGADLAEPFVVSDPSIQPGTVVVIDEDHPGQLKLSTRAYDSTVAGVVSGAGGVAPGIRMNQQDRLPSGRDVALSGRVYAWVDASLEPVKPGDLLTTSDRPGHAMKAANPTRVQGAILGKAMTPLKSGQGLVLVLVSLQ